MPSGDPSLPDPDSGTGRLAVWLGWGAWALALLRFLRLGDWGLWIDEAHTLHDAMALFDGRPVTYPLGYLAVRAAIALHGGAIDEVTLRIAPALFGAASIPLCAWALRPGLGRLAANATAFLLGASSWQLYWSQNARGYSLALLIVVLGLGLWMRGLQSGRGAWLVGGIAVTAVSAFSHPSGALLLPGLVLAPLVLVGLRMPGLARQPVKLLVTAAVVGALALSGWALRVWDRHEFVKPGTSWGLLIKTCGWYMGPLTLIAAGWGSVLTLRERKPAPLALAIVGATAGALALCASLQTVVSAQYVFVVFPYVLAAAAWPIARLRPGLPRGLLLGALALPGLIDSALYMAVRHGDRPRWREAYAYVREHRGEDDLVYGAHAPVGEYYLLPGKLDLRSHEGLLRMGEITYPQIAHALRRGRRVWLVVNPEDLMAWSPPARREFEQQIARDAKLQVEYDVPFTPRDLRVRVYLLGD